MTSEAHRLEFFLSLEGAENARIISIAFFALYVYEWAITLDEEVRYFWTGPWTASRFLFLLNRYVPPLVMILGLVCFFVPNPTPEFCLPAIQTGFIANIASIGIVQAMLILRVWYLFSGSKMMQWSMIVAFILSFGLSLLFAILTASELELLSRPPLSVTVAVGCQAARPKGFWRMFFPSLILHTLLYILTAVRALRNRRILKNAPILKRLLRDGGFFYFVVFVTIGFSGVGAFLRKDPLINIPVVFSNYLISVTAIAISRVMFSIHSLAACLGSDTAWLLNNVELSRVGWKQGATEGEIIVERWSAEEEAYDEEASVSSIPMQNAPFKMTRVGVYNDDAML